MSEATYELRRGEAAFARRKRSAAKTGGKGAPAEREPVADTRVRSRLDALHAGHVQKVREQLRRDAQADLPDAEVIAQSVTLDADGNARGILNARVNGNHVQLRFNEATSAERIDSHRPSAGP
ncbi:MAG: hypothetical protein GVY24_06055 [Planctomycetes bacterium]|jgi:uncharacterized protein YcbX|nr:hypothetical protein [Planctomycetota bacterium]